MKKALFVLFCLTGILGMAGCREHETGSASAPPAPAVTVATVKQTDIVEWEEFTGRAEAIESVEVRPQVSGYVQQVRFQSGQLVHKGDVLFEIDPRWYEANFKKLEAETDRAKVQLENAQHEADRTKHLLADHAISAEEGEERVSRYAAAKASLEAANAARDYAKLDLEFTQVRAPVDGRVSRALFTQGNYVSGGTGAGTVLTTLVSVDPVYVYADVDEDSFLKFKGLVASGQIETNADGRIPVEMELADENGFPRRGYIESLDNHLDEGTGSIILRATFANKDQRIVPGLFARIRLPLSGRHPAVLVADRVIGTDQARKYVLTLTSSNTVAYQAVQLGPMVEGQRVVRSGLRVGDKIIVNGMARVRPGMAVSPETEAAAAEAQRIAVK